MIKINDNNRTELISQYVNMLMEDIIEQMPKYDLYTYSMNFLLEEKTILSNETLMTEIVEKYPDILSKYSSKVINDENRTQIVSEYVNELIMDLSTEIPKYTLYDYAMKFLLKEKTLLSNEYLEAEIRERYSILLDKNNE